jgi:membrane protease subunit HflK
VPESDKTPDAPPVDETVQAGTPAAAEPEMDLSHQSLATALRFSFMALKIVIVLLIIGYLFSGFYVVKQDEVAIALRFGQVVGLGEDLVRRPGAHLNWPRPVGEVVRIRTGVRDLAVSTFWPEVGEADKEKAAGDQAKGREQELRKASVDRVYEGAENAFLMTGDLMTTVTREGVKEGITRRAPAPNLLQARFTVRYKVRPGSAIDYFHTVRDEASEKTLVKFCLESAAIREAAGLEVYDLLKAKTETYLGRVRESLQTALNEVRSGITVEGVSMADPLPPKDVRPSFNDVLAAQQEKKSLSDAAEAYRNDLLRECAGEVGADLGDAILALWDLEDGYSAEDAQRAEAVKQGKAQPAAATERGETERRRKAEIEKHQARVKELLAKATGDVQRKTSEAEIYARQVRERTGGLARRMKNFLVEYGGQPEFLEKMRLDAIQDLLADAYEKIYVARKNSDRTREMRLIISRNPEVLKTQRKVEDTR